MAKSNQKRYGQKLLIATSMLAYKSHHSDLFRIDSQMTRARREEVLTKWQQLLHLLPTMCQLHYNPCMELFQHRIHIQVAMALKLHRYPWGGNSLARKASVKFAAFTFYVREGGNHIRTIYRSIVALARTLKQ